MQLLHRALLIDVVFSCQPQDSSADSSVVSDEGADHTLVELLETEVRLPSYCSLVII